MIAEGLATVRGRPCPRAKLSRAPEHAWYYNPLLSGDVQDRQKAMFDIGTFSMIDKVAVTSALRIVSANARGMDEAAERLVRYFYESLGDESRVEGSCALVRLYVTMQYRELDEESQTFARRLAGFEPEPTMRCLSLRASAGDEPAWNDPSRSAGHRAIPLVNVDMVRSSPMIAQLILQLGLDISQVVAPDPSILMRRGEVDYNVFYVPEALGSPFIPAQESFVIPYGIQSVLGFGGLLPSGELAALILFSKAHIPVEAAELFKTLALSLRSALLSATLAEEQSGTGASI